MREDEIEIYKMTRPAIKQGNLAEVVRLIGNDPSRLRIDSPFGTWLHMAASHGKLDIVRWLVSQGVDVNAIGGMGERRAIDEAAANGYVDVVKLLLDSGATLDVSESVRNPLFAAIVGGISDSHTAVAKLLIDSGIDTTVKYPNLDNMDALEHAREWGRSDIVKLLEETNRPK
jgi:uncharacterized protein